MLPVFLLLLAASSVTRGSSVLCIEEVCSSVATTERAVAPKEAARPFVLIERAKAVRVRAGIIAPGATAIPTEDAHEVSVRLPIRTAKPVSKPMEISFELHDANARWHWKSSYSGPATTELRFAPCDCTLLISAPGHRSIQRKLGSAAAVAVVLEPLPRLRLIVSDDANRPIREAVATSPDGEILGRSDRRGVVDTPLAEWPPWIMVSAAGRAPKVLAVPLAAADTDLGVIHLGSGGSLLVRIPASLRQEPLRWELWRLTVSDRAIRDGSVAVSALQIPIEGIAAGQYRLLLRGERPLQRVAIPVSIAENDLSTVQVEITPALLDVAITFDEDPLPGARVKFDHESGWTSDVTADEEGKLREETWQDGRLTAIISSKPLIRYWLEKKHIGGDGPRVWTIRIPDRRATGRVLDAETRKPIAGVTTLLQLKLPDGGSVQYPTTTSGDGLYEFGAIPDGNHRLAFQKQGYQSETQELSISSEVRADVREVLLISIPQRPALVVNRHGMPVAGAGVLVSRRGGAQRAGFTDADGRVLLPIFPDDQTAIVFAVPTTGSFGMALLTSTGNLEEPFVIRVPDPAAPLEIRCETTDGKPLPKVSVLFRVNGVVIPPAMLENLRHLQGMPLVSDEQGRLFYRHLPPGHYEIWPMANRSDLDLAMSDVRPAAPVILTLADSPQTVILRYRAR